MLHCASGSTNGVKLALVQSEFEARVLARSFAQALRNALILLGGGINGHQAS